MEITTIPMTHGMEIEQFHDIVPNAILDDPTGRFWGNWERDPSGPYEMEFGPKKHVKRMIDDFLSTARQVDSYPWTWTSGRDGEGAGSHVHFNVEHLPDHLATVTAWTISFNSIVEIVPFFAPFFCHNWEKGFRNGERYTSNTAVVERYAAPMTRRYSTDTVEQWTEGQMGSRSFDAVTLNPRQGEKPLTIELRLSDSHPVFALTGSYFLRKVVKRSLEREWSIKIDREASDTANVIQEMYNRMYDIPDNSNLIREMQRPLKIVFEHGRGIPTVEQHEFESPWAVLSEMLIGLNPPSKRADRRAVDLVRYAGSIEQMRQEDEFLTDPPRQIPNPARNPRSIWTVDQPVHEWECGPADA